MRDSERRFATLAIERNEVRKQALQLQTEVAQYRLPVVEKMLSLWILGLSILLAAFSYHDWLAKETGQRRRELFRRRSWRLPFAAGIVLTCAGWGIADDRGGRRIILGEHSQERLHLWMMRES